MNALAEKIAALIAAQGPISISAFMSLALHDPQAGYYATRDPLGAAGDFTTAPEISQVFGEILGLWFVQLWHDQGRPPRKRLVELGPGRGTLLADALRAAGVMPEFLDGLEIVLVEASAVLRNIQREKLGPYGNRIRWLSHFDAALGDEPLYLLANEFFDALPIRQYVKAGRGWFERMVTTDAAGRLAFGLSPVPLPPHLVPEDSEHVPEGSVLENRPAADALAEEIAQAIERRGGGALIVDYGHDAPGFGDTLQAVAGHAFSSVLDKPGESDLSAHVNFRTFAECARVTGASVFGPVDQGVFLQRLGAAQRVQQLAIRNPSSAQMLRSQLDRLVNPDHMGRLFKALAILPRATAPPPGF